MKSLSSKLRCALIIAVLAMMSPARLFACAACYGESDAPMAKGLTFAIIALAGIIAFVLSGVVVFFVHLGKKSSTATDAVPTESAQRKL